MMAGAGNHSGPVKDIVISWTSEAAALRQPCDVHEIVGL